MRIAVRFRPLDVGNETLTANVLVGKTTTNPKQQTQKHPPQKTKKQKIKQNKKQNTQKRKKRQEKKISEISQTFFGLNVRKFS